MEDTEEMKNLKPVYIYTIQDIRNSRKQALNFSLNRLWFIPAFVLMIFILFLVFATISYHQHKALFEIFVVISCLIFLVGSAISFYLIIRLCMITHIENLRKMKNSYSKIHNDDEEKEFEEKELEEKELEEKKISLNEEE